MPDQTQHNEPQAPNLKTSSQPDQPTKPTQTTQTTQTTQPNPEDASADSIQTQEEEDLEAQLAYENLKRKREARKRKRILIGAIVGVVVLVGVLVFMMGQANKEASEGQEEVLATGTAYQGDFASTVTANGATEPVASTVVSPEVDGIVENLQVQEGDTVKEGDVLFTLKNESLDKEVRDAETELRNAERAVDSANRSVNDAYDSYNRAVDEYNKAVQDAANATVETEDGTVVGGEEPASFDESSLRSAIDSAEDAYDQALETRDAAKTKVEEAKKNTEKRTVRAPVSGTIVSLNVKNGTNLGSTSGNGSSSGSDGTIMQISDLSKMKVTVQVNEVDISKISKGQTAKATFSAIPGLELDATVEHIASVSSGSGSAEGGSTGGGVVTYSVDLLIPKPDDKLKPGMTATVAITTQSVPNSIIVPAAAVHDGFLDDGTPGKSVTVLDDEKTKQTHEVPVEVVAENESEAAIKGKIAEGDVVMLSDASMAGGLDAANMDTSGIDAGTVV